MMNYKRGVVRFIFIFAKMKRITLIILIILVGFSCKKKNESPITAKYVFTSNSTAKMRYNVAGFQSDTIIGNTSITMTWGYRTNGVILDCYASLLSDTVSKDYCQVFIYVNGSLFATGNIGKTSTMKKTYNW